MRMQNVSEAYVSETHAKTEAWEPAYEGTPVPMFQPEDSAKGGKQLPA
jgi:hypothetical protein